MDIHLLSPLVCVPPYHDVHVALGAGFIIALQGEGVALNVLGSNDFQDLSYKTKKQISLAPSELHRENKLSHTKQIYAYSLLELVQVGRGHGVGLGDDGDQVDTGAQTLHDLNVEGLQGVAGGADKVQAAVDTHVAELLALGLLVLTHVRLVLIIDKVHNGHPAVAVVGVVAESGCINDGQFDVELLLLELCCTESN